MNEGTTMPLSTLEYHSAVGVRRLELAQGLWAGAGSGGGEATDRPSTAATFTTLAP